MPATPSSTAPAVPEPRGPISDHIVKVLTGEAVPGAAAPEVGPASLGDEDQSLALYCLYELSYRGFAGVDDELEWNCGLLKLRARLEWQLLEALRAEVPHEEPDGPVPDALRRLVDDGADAPSLSTWCLEHGDHEHMIEQAVHRSAFQLKEADPHSFALPRLHGEPKAALARIQFDEYGEGVQRDIHAELYALHMERLGLDGRYGAYLDVIPGSTLTTSNLVSLFGLHRRWRGALVGHLAMFEMASVPVVADLAATTRKLGYDDWTCLFYDVHVVADAEHQTVAADELAGGLARQEPDLSADIIWGARCLAHLEGMVAAKTIAAWEAGASSLLGPVEAARAPGLYEDRGAADDPRRDPRTGSPSGDHSSADDPSADDPSADRPSTDHRLGAA